jgi:hypothetical protein
MMIINTPAKVTPPTAHPEIGFVSNPDIDMLLSLVLRQPQPRKTVSPRSEVIG